MSSDDEAPPNWPPRFTIDRHKILKLLTGDRFYSDSSAALREAILNAIDAVHRRQHKEPSLLADLSVIFNDSDLTLTVSDNGDGMTREAVASLFAKIGASASELEAGRDSVGEFGIGVISYFIASETFSLQTQGADGQRIGLRFSKDMLAGAPALELAPARSSRGTSVSLSIRDRETFDLLIKSFSHWCRDVAGLRALRLPQGIEMKQGDSDRVPATSGLPTADWIERAHLAPVSGPSAWDSMTGTSTISILYRGMLVQEFSARGLWGIRGSIDVDPKKFKPRLNREGFVGTEFQNQVKWYLKAVHPKILAEMAAQLSSAVERGQLDSWSQRRWATLWLSIPRGETYKDACEIWDKAFRAVPAFELASGNRWTPLSLNDLVRLPSPVYIAPLKEEQSSDIIVSALRLLRHTGRPVIRGLRSDRNWLRDAPSVFGTTADLITSVFSNELPDLVSLAAKAEEVLAEVSPSITLYGGKLPIDLFKLGAESPPIIKLTSRLAINVDHRIGRKIVEEVIEENVGRWSLIAIVAAHSLEHVQQITSAVKGTLRTSEPIGLVKRRHIRKLLK